jgi:hypothetical protein
VAPHNLLQKLLTAQVIPARQQCTLENVDHGIPAVAHDLHVGGHLQATVRRQDVVEFTLITADP